MDQEGGFDPATRRLCPDGACIGVLGADGVCGECGKRFDVPAGGAAPIFVAPVSDEPSTEPQAPGSGFDPNRRMCDDGSCVGVIGANGACTVCGRLAG